MVHLEDILSMFKLHMGDMVLSKDNTILLYKNDSSAPFGQIRIADGEYRLRVGFGTRSTRTSVVKRTSNGISFSPVISERDV